MKNYYNKKYLLTVFFSFLLFSCAETKVLQVGKFNMVSTRNVDVKNDYVLLKKSTKLSNKQLRKSSELNIENAINNYVKSVPGGEFLMNAEVYKVGGEFSINGDIYGTEQNAKFFGPQVGNKVFFYYKKKYKEGIIKVITDNKVIIEDEDGKQHTRDLADISVIK